MILHLVSVLLIGLASHASDADLALTPHEAFTRTQAVLEHFKIHTDTSTLPSVSDLAGLQEPTQINLLLPFIDSQKMFSRLHTLNNLEYTAYQDYDSKDVLDFSVSMRPKTINTTAIEFHSRILDVQKNNPNEALNGLRIALDPGHMGDERWDLLTGKYVKHRDGRKLSEGLLALQTALLLEKELVALGASVLITHRRLGPVSNVALENLDLTDFAKKELQSSTLTNWFQKLLSTAPVGPKLFKAFEDSTQVQTLFNESSRKRYFILREDLQARADLINSFKPDIVLIIHMDTGATDGVNTEKFNKTKAFIQGNLAPEEWSSAKDRRLLARHLLNPYSWTASLQLSRSVVHSISKNLNIELENYNVNNSQVVEPGISTRNLYLSRNITDTALSYVECFYYNDPEEFENLYRYNKIIKIDGVAYPYSERLALLVEALKIGVLNFTADYR